MKTLILGCFLIFSFNLYAQDFIPLWPADRMPNSKGMALKYIEERERITQVSEPGIYSFFPSLEENQESAVLICPPGGYQKLTYILAGFQFAKFLNTLGISAFVLIHRLPTSPDLLEPENGPLQDVQRAMRIIRSGARDWNINEDKIGIMGASAGGHLASTLGTHVEDFSSIGDSLDGYAFLPNFMILISPVVSMGAYTHQGSQQALLGKTPSAEDIEKYSNELHVGENTPPTFLVHAQNDAVVPAENSMLFYQAMLKNEVVGSLHIFPEGGHSIALRNNPGSTGLWTQLCESWLKETGIIR